MNVNSLRSSFSYDPSTPSSDEQMTSLSSQQRKDKMIIIQAQQKLLDVYVKEPKLSDSKEFYEAKSSYFQQKYQLAKEDVLEARKKNEELESQNSTLKNQLTLVSEDNSAIKENLAIARDSNTKKNRLISNLQHNIEQANFRNEQIKTINLRQRDIISGLDHRVQILTSVIKDLNDKNEALLTYNRSQEQQNMTGRKRKREDTDTDLAILKQQNEELAQQLKKYKVASEIFQSTIEIEDIKPAPEESKQ